MAALERRNQTYRVVFMHGGRKHGFSLETKDKSTAEALRGGVEKTLMLLGQGALTLHEGMDVVTFVRSGGKPPPAAPPPEPISFAKLRDRYLETHRNGAMEESSLLTIGVHLKHLGETLGEKYPARSLTLADMQRHIDRRLGKKYRGRRLSPVTVRKEVTTLRTIWNWGVLHGLVSGSFPSKGLVYPKTDEKASFLTWTEIERKIAGGMVTPEREELWDCLYLRKEEIAQLLTFVKEHAAHPWLYPMVCTAAHTGARRSELLRIEVTDVDLETDSLLIREKKRSRKQRTTRHVSLTPFLKNVLKDWLATHPGGRFLFAQAGIIARSKKRSSTTGHRGNASRESTSKGRTASVRKRVAQDIAVVTHDEAHDHLRRTLTGSKWKVLKGFHVLRHSFISCLAAEGVDQRIIDEFVGHQTDEQRRRYRHLLPDVKLKAIAEAFS